MEKLLEQIIKAHEVELYYLSLFATLALPDICGALESLDGKATGQRYKDWYEKNVVPYYDRLTAEECYIYRCTALHQGSAEPNRSTDYERIVFVDPRFSTISARRARISGKTFIPIDIDLFIQTIIKSVRAWFESVKGKQPFETNYKTFMKFYPNGYQPYFIGFPMFA